MPFPFTLPTTASTDLIDSFSSSSHPALISAASRQRALLRSALKKHRKLDEDQRDANLPVIQDALKSYIPYVFAIYNGVPDGTTSTSYGGKIQVTITHTTEFETEWRCTICPGIPGRDPSRVKVKGLRNEVAFVLETLAYTHWDLARAKLLQLYQRNYGQAGSVSDCTNPAMKHLLEAHAIHVCAAGLVPSDGHSVPLDVNPNIVSGLAALSLAEATLLAVLKDDPYVAAVAHLRDDDNRDWMIAAPKIPKVRALLFARLCVAAADHAAKATSLLPRSHGVGMGRLDDTLVDYAKDMRRTARGKAARFLAIDAELNDKTGEAIAWLRGAKRELGIADNDEAKRKGLKGLKHSWLEKREDKRLATGDIEWGTDAGRFEEVRVVESLEKKWVRSNNTINVQVVPPFEPLLATMPSGRECHSPQVYVPEALSPEVLGTLKGPVITNYDDDLSDDSGVDADPRAPNPPGTFPQIGRGVNAYY